jgi:hypothetical protein
MNKKEKLKKELSVGIKSDQNKAPIRYLCREFLEGTAMAQEYGAKKYSPWNYTKGISYNRLLDAAIRHLIAYQNGEDLDPESLLNHICHASANLNMLQYMIKNKPEEMDDRLVTLQKNNKI